MLDHPKWRRALRDGGDAVALLWLRLTSWCSRRLTDGEVPADLVDQVAELGQSKARRRALAALVDAGLVAWCDPSEDTSSVRRGSAEPAPRARRERDVLVIVGYLQRNPTRASVTADRERRAQHMRSRYVAGNLTGQTPARPTSHEPSPATERDAVPSRPDPTRPESPSLVGSSQASGASELDGAVSGPLYDHFPDGWRWSPETEAAAAMQGVDAAALAEHVRYWTTHVWRIAVRDLEGELRRSIPDIRSRRETQSARASGPTGRRYGSAQPNAGKTGWEHLDDGGKP